MNRRRHAARDVPDPGGDIAAYLRRRAVAEGFEQMNLVLRRALQRREADPGRVSAQVTRLPVNVLDSELSLRTAPVPDRYRTGSFGTRSPAKEDRIGGLAGLSVPLLPEGLHRPHRQVLG